MNTGTTKIHRTTQSNAIFAVSWALAQTPMDPDTLGVIIYLLSKPADWECSVSDVEKHFRIGKDRRRRIFAEAERLGHFTGERRKDEKGQFKGLTWHVWDNAAPEELRTTLYLENEGTGDAQTADGKPARGKPVSLHEERLSQEERERHDIKLHSSTAVDAPKPTASLKRPSKELTMDARSKHPAIAAMRHVMGRYPSKSAWDLLIGALGEQPDVERLKRVWDEWCFCGHSPVNYRGVTDWYLSKDAPIPLTKKEQSEKRFWNSIP